ncbi:MAG: YchJ family protein [Gammaproteobacteria bacterium]|jgi:SEC-C motif-containing protein
MSLCPCQSQKSYAQCCEPFITGNARPQTPEQLMRSRYTAYTQANTDYIVATMQGKPLEGYDKEASKKWAQSVKWLGLEVIDAPKPQAKKGFVEFIASYEENGEVKNIHERSEFARIGGGTRWYYVAGQTPKVERNALCPCGSGKKYKKCCGFKG